MSEFKFGQASLNRLQSVDERLQRIANLALSISKVDFGIPSNGGLRTAEEQNRLYHGGKSQLDGYKKKSFHQTGKALDVYAFVNGKASWEREHLAMVACAMLQAASTLGYKLEWGGHWRNFVDMPHFELSD
jgi:hypothetical protein